MHFIKKNLTFSKESADPRASLLLSILGSFVEFERAITHERQAEGIALAKKAGKCKSRKRVAAEELKVVDRGGSQGRQSHPLPGTREGVIHLTCQYSRS